MTEVDRDIALVLLKHLWERELITEEVYIAAIPKYSIERTLLRWQNPLKLKSGKVI